MQYPGLFMVAITMLVCVASHKCISYVNYDCVATLYLPHYYRPLTHHYYHVSTQYGWTPLHFAVNNNDQDMVEWLVTLGADIHKVGYVSMF